MNTSEKIEQVSAALFEVHAALENPRTDAKGQVRGKADYTYLSLPALIDHLRPLLKDHHLFVTQELTGGAGFAEVITTIWHSSGEWIAFGPTFMPAAGDAQAAGSAVTYGRRYALSAAFDLAADRDDDGAAASGRGRRAGSERPAPSQPPASNVPSSAGEPTGEGPAGDGAILATEAQWANLLSAVGGKVNAAVSVLNDRNGTRFEGYREAKEAATSEQLERALLTV